MESLRRMLGNIGAGLGKLNTTQKMLVACIAVIFVLLLVVVAQQSGRASRVSLMAGMPVEDQQRAAAALDRQGIVAEFVGGDLTVASGDERRARSVIAESNVLPSDKVLYFETLVQSQNWMNSRQVNEQNFNIALQNELARMIEDFKGIKSATVVIDAPEPQGLGKVVRQPKGGATIMTDSGQALSQEQVDAIASLIAGSKAGLTIENVKIIDAGVGGRVRRPTVDGESGIGTAFETASKVESQLVRKVEDLLGFIPGVTVAVTASVDVARSTSTTQSFLPEKQGTVALDKRTTETTTSTNETSSSAVPGVEANQTADITRSASGQGSRMESTEATTERENHVGSKTETIVDPKGKATAVAVSIGVPRSFVVGLLKKPAEAGAEAPKAPSDAEVLAKFDADVRPVVLGAITPQVRAMISHAGGKPEDMKRELEDSISVTLLPMDAPSVAIVQTAGVAGVLTGSGPLALGSGIVEKVALGGLSLVAMALMLVMVRKAGKRTDTPSAEELVGLPPALDAEADVMGEADEGETAMEGIEVDERQMQSEKVLEQVGDMVQKDPTVAAKLLQRWINVDE